MTDEIDRRPAGSGYVRGDVNILPAHFHGEDAAVLYLRVGAGLVSIDREQLVGGQHDGGRLDIHVRPEHLRFEPLNADAALTGTIVDHARQAGYVDTYVDVNFASGEAQRVLVRSSGHDVITRLPVGTVTALVLPAHDVTVHPR